MKTYGLRDIIGPVMIGPSSSHTAGALAISSMARRLLAAPPVSATFTLYGSFAYTGTGHGTDKALVAGILGLAADDARIRTSFELAREMGVDVRVVFDRDTEPDHPNTVDIHAVTATGDVLDVRGISIGGGAAVITRIDDVDVNITGEHTSIVVEQNDVVGVLAHIAGVVAEARINIATATVYRTARHKTAFTVMEVDSPGVPDLAERLYANPNVLNVRVIPAAGANVSSDANNCEGDGEGAGEGDTRAPGSLDAAEQTPRNPQAGGGGALPANAQTKGAMQKDGGFGAYTGLADTAYVQKLSDAMQNPAMAATCVSGAQKEMIAHETSNSKGGVDAELHAQVEFEKWDFTSGQELMDVCEREGVLISQAFRNRERALCALRGETYDIDAYLERVISVMKAEATEPILNPVRSVGGLIGGEAQLVASMADTLGVWRNPRSADPAVDADSAAFADVFVSAGGFDAGATCRPSPTPSQNAFPQANRAGEVCAGAKFSLVDPLAASAVSFALATLETNASMGCIVATPTAGSAGVLPGVLLSLAVHRGVTENQLKAALLTCAAVGSIIARNASVSGAEGGCQAEVGSAAAMAAAAAVELAGGEPKKSIYASANALMSLMGLVCDPVGGLVEVPCQKRNATASLVALTSAQIALSGVNNAITFDDAVSAMDAVGRSLPFELRESALGGIAAVPSACQACAACS